MSSDAGIPRPPAVEVRCLGKCYRIYRRPEDRLKQALLRGRRKYHREFWALQDVSLSIAPGETVGIVGQNGSGKSTLLEMIAGTLEPTTGEYELGGRVAALLELGTGFNPEFSGRENVYLAAAVAGLDRRQVDERFEEIAAFADIGDFIDQPLKTYSSGMLLRLAFAVATSVDPAVLLVDEVLAVGDEAFQRKCFARMEEIRRRGAAILFASHDATSVLSLCDRVLLLDSGEQLLLGDPKRVVEAYQRLSYADPAERAALRRELVERGVELESPTAARYDSELVAPSAESYRSLGAEIDDVRIETPAGDRVNVLVRGETYSYVYRVRFAQIARSVRCGMLIKTKTGFELGGAVSHPVSEAIPQIEAGAVLEVRFRFTCHLLPGHYFFNAGVLGHVAGVESYLHRVLDAAAIRVPGEPELRATGLVDFEIEPLVRRLAAEAPSD